MMSSDTKFGVVIFDDPERPATGWASLAGERPRRINHLSSLESDGVFVSNLDWQQIFNINASREPRLRCSNFLREELSIICQDLDLPIFEDPASCLNTLSEFVDRSVRLAMETYGFERVGKTLKESIYETLFPKGEAASYGTPKIDEAFGEAYLPLQRCYTNNIRASRNAKLRFARATFARLLSKFPIPIGPWTVYKGQLPDRGKGPRSGEDSAVYKFLKEFGGDKPALCKVSVRNVDKACAELLGHTNGTDRRDWVPIQEAAFLSTISEVTVKSMIVGSRYQSYEDVHYGWKEQSAVGDVSYSLGLVAEAHISALSSGTKKPGGGTAYSPRAVFLKAWDRILLFKTAFALHQRDICVTSFAMGAVNVAIEDHQLKFVAEECLRQGLTPPMWLLNANMLDEELGEGASDGEQDVRLSTIV